MSAFITGLVTNPWVSIIAAMAAFVLLFAALQRCAQTSVAGPETSRKLLHTGSGLLTLAFPFVFHEVWPVLLLTGGSALLIGAARFVPCVRERLGAVAGRVDRSTLGELYFPLSVAILFVLTLGEHPLLFVIPVLMLSLADATCAIVGRRYGLTPYTGASKSFEGSVAFVVVAFFCVHVPLLLWSGVGRAESLLIAATLALLVMLLEGSAWRGLDNLFIPLGGYFLLRAHLGLDAAALLARLTVTLALLLLIVVSRRRTTLEDDSLVAAAFFSYVAWVSMGWQWLVAPIVIFVAHSWLSPPTADNSRRMHGVPAVLSIWAAAIGWLALAHAGRGSSLLFPYTIVFAAQLAMFGLSRLAHQFPERRLGRLFWRAVLASWAIVIVPFFAVTGLSVPNLTAAAGAIVAIALGTAAFLLTQPIRAVPQTARRWLCQAGGASVASGAAWALANFAGRGL